MGNISQLFSAIDGGECLDVATSMGLLGANTAMEIPIYEVFYLKIAAGESVQFLCSEEEEFYMIRQLAESCGAVACAVNIIGCDTLTIAGVMLISTPNTGMNLFIKLGEIVTGDISEQGMAIISEITHIPLPKVRMPGMGVGMNTKMLQQAIPVLMDELVENMNEELSEYGITVRQWEELPELYWTVRNTGEMANMHQHRQMFGGVVF